MQPLVSHANPMHAREMASDADLVARARRDPRAFGELFDRYWNDIFKFCYYRLGDWHRAEDIASQVFLEAMSSLAGFDPRDRDDSFRAWLFGIARNVTASAIRTAQQHPTAPLENASAVEDGSISPEEHAVVADELDRLRQLLAQLTPEQQELVELRLAGLTSVEIARLLGKSHDAVRKAQSRTMAALRDAAARTPGFSSEAQS